MYTTSFAFFEAIWEAGITHCFVNLGSDHPSIVEAFVKGQKEKPGEFPKIITCPNEMVALAMADGYARLTGKPQCVIVHVDVGTQGLASAVHDASMGRCPVLIFAGLSPFTIEGEMRGSRTEYIHWIQDVPDQKQIVAQYCRYAGELKTGKNVKQMVNRALSFATSDPKGPVYLVGAREVMEEEVTPYKIEQKFWTPVQPAALPPHGVAAIAQALAEAKEPLVITGYSGRNHNAVAQLVALADIIKGLRVLDTGGSDMCFPADHRAWLGLKYGVDESITSADAILVLDADVPWMPTQCKPRADARIFHVDVDPLKRMMPVYYIDAVARFHADAETALRQLNAHVRASPPLRTLLDADDVAARWDRLGAAHARRLADIAARAAPAADGTFGASYLVARVKAHVPADAIWVVEAVTNAPLVADQAQVTRPGHWINCGGGGLGWSGGASLGVKLATTTKDYPRPGPAPSSSTHDDTVNGAPTPAQAPTNPPFILQVVGDGTYLFSVPSSVAWIAARYSLPTLTIILNNSGWHAPRRSTLLVHPDGAASRASDAELNISFAPAPDYAGIACAAAGGKERLWAGRAADVRELERVLGEAVRSVMEGKPAVVDAQLGGSEGKFCG